jgi:dGTPase
VHGVEIVSRIEDEYIRRQAGTFGLNLTFDVVDGILKHIYDPEAMPGSGSKTAAKLPDLVKYAAYRDYGNNKGSIEAQCVYLADRTAYLLGDIEDAIGRRIFLCNELREDEFITDLWNRYAKLRDRNDELTLKDSRDFLEFRGAALTVLILDAVEHSLELIQKARPASVPEVLQCPTRLVTVSGEIAELWNRFYEKWCKGTLYQHRDVTACKIKAKKIVDDLFVVYRDNPDLIEDSYRDNCREAYEAAGVNSDDDLKLLMVSNYVAGMTDAYAIERHAALFMSSERIIFS